MANAKPTATAFLREATGLVRSFGWRDAFLISIASIGPGIFGYSSQIVFLASADPGSDVVLATFLGLLVSIPLAITYYYMSASIPRSGGDYVWVSRFINPVVGFMASWSFWIAILSVVGIISSLEGTTILPISLVSLGYAFHNPSLVSAASAVSEPLSVLAVGIIMISIATAISGFGPKVFSRVMFILFGIILLGTLISFYILGTSTHADFVNAISGYGGTNVTYSGIINQAQSLSGFSFTPIVWTATLSGIPLALLLFAGFNVSAAASGEVRKPKSSMIGGVILSLAVAALIDIVGIQLSLNVISYNFEQASVAIGSAWPFAAPAWMPLFVSMLTNNPILLVLFHLGWILTLVWAAAGALIVANRYTFAFSFDRAFPTMLADINERFHFPLKAALLNLIVSLVFLVLATYTSFLGLFLNATAIYAVLWGLGSAAAIIVSFRKRDLIKGLPGGLWRIPSVAIVGIISLVSMILSFYLDITTPAVGPSTPQADAILAGIFIVGLVVYVARYQYNKSKGIDPRLIYAEIPPE